MQAIALKRTDQGIYINISAMAQIIVTSTGGYTKVYRIKHEDNPKQITIRRITEVRAVTNHTNPGLQSGIIAKVKVPDIRNVSERVKCELGRSNFPTSAFDTKSALTPTISYVDPLEAQIMAILKSSTLDETYWKPKSLDCHASSDVKDSFPKVCHVH